MDTKKGVIILGGFIQALSLVRSLAELDIPVYVAEDKECLAGFSRYCNKFLKSPKSDSPELAAFLLSVAKKYGLKDWLLLPTNDHQVENLSKNRETLQDYYKFLVPAESDLYHIINKKNLLEIAKTCGTNIPRTCYIESIEEAQDFRYPLLVKGNYGCSFYQTMHKKAFKVDTYEELQEVLDNLSKVTDVHDVMIQEVIPSRACDHVLSFTCFAIQGEIKSFWMGEKLRERPIDNGTATFAMSVMHQEVISQASPLMKAQRYTGACEVEFMYDHRDDMWKLIEINPRTWKWVGLAKDCGIDYAKMLYRYANGIAQDYPKTYTVGTKWIDHLTDPIVGLKMIKANRIKLTDYIKSYSGKTLAATWSWKDPLPTLFFPFYSIICKFKRII